ncbi:MAG: phosphoribosyltransferase family protein [Patescibacteria group bacterium]|jgi:uridine monophosphate synthetase|nr:phosphoribosyltransferase family protein [Patescibacteria group bacterium]
MITKKHLMKEIIRLNIFKICESPNKEDWVLLKNGSRTPLFLDTSLFNSYPKLSKKINKYIVKLIKKENINFNKIMGLPYGGLLFGYGVANILNIPYLAIRKEGKKNYSTKGNLLGLRSANETILLIEDATVTANTALDFIKTLRNNNLIINDIITIIDIEKGAKKNLFNKNVNLYSLFTWRDLYELYQRYNPIKDELKIIFDKFVY